MDERPEQLGWFDSFIVRVSPTWALRRAESRLQMNALRDLRSYAGAEFSKLIGDWSTQIGTSSDAELLDSGDQATMRNRSRDLNQNDPHAAAATSTMVSYTVGDRVRIQAKCIEDSLPLPPSVGRSRQIIEEVARVANAHAESAFAEIEHSIDGRKLSFTEFVELMFRQELECGESLCQLVNRERPDTSLTTAVNPIEPDRLLTPHDMRQDSNVQHGIEYDDDGAPGAYWISDRHPGDSGFYLKSDSFTRVKAENIVHSFTVKRPGQSRGEPWFAPALKYFRHKSQSTEAELVAQRVAACIAAFVTTDNPKGVASAVSTSARTSDGAKYQKLEPGKIFYLRTGEKVEFGDPTRPGTNWVPSHHEILRAIGAALNIPYVVLAKDFENVNYSSMRAAIIDLQRYVAINRARLNTRVVRLLWSRFYAEAVVAGMILAPNYAARKNAYHAFKIQWPGSQWVDPFKEVQADVLAVESKLLPHEYILAKYGLDLDALRQIADEQELKSEMGIEPSENGNVSVVVNDDDDRVIPRGLNGRSFNGHRNDDGKTKTERQAVHA